MKHFNFGHQSRAVAFFNTSAWIPYCLIDRVSKYSRNSVALTMVYFGTDNWSVIKFWNFTNNLTPTAYGANILLKEDVADDANNHHPLHSVYFLVMSSLQHAAHTALSL